MKRAKPLFFTSFILFSFIVTPLIAQDSRGLDVVAKNVIGDAAIGRQIAVIIAIDKYREWMPLQNPVKDAREIRTILAEKYFIDEFDELCDANATKAAIFRLLDRLASSTRPEDSVLIYYAGHGYLDEKSSTSFWAPVDAGQDKFEQKNWIASAQLRGYLSNLKARHVLLISDSCFAGDILDASRSAEPIIDAEYYRNAYARVSRQVLTSGASETVSDTSSFSRQLKLALDGNTQPCVDPLGLFFQIRLGVTGSTPLLGSLKDSGQQQGGAFLLFRKGTVGEASVSTGIASPLPLTPPSMPTSYQYFEYFSGDPAWATSDSTRFFWDSRTGTYHANPININFGGNYAIKKLGINMSNRSFILEFDINVTYCDYASGLMFGLYDTSMNSDDHGNFIYAVFTHGDGGYAVFSGSRDINNISHSYATYQGTLYRLNTWYHVIINYTAMKRIMTLQVAQGNTIVISYSFSSGSFSSDMDRIGFSDIRNGKYQVHGASAECAIDNVTFSSK